MNNIIWDSDFNPKKAEEAKSLKKLKIRLLPIPPTLGPIFDSHSHWLIHNAPWRHQKNRYFIIRTNGNLVKFRPAISVNLNSPSKLAPSEQLDRKWKIFFERKEFLKCIINIFLIPLFVQMP